MKHIFITTLALFLVPFITFAQTIPDYLIAFRGFFNSAVLFLIGVAFFIFIVNVFRYFIVESTNEAGREKARALAVYGILAFLIFVIFWGIINLVTSTFGIDDNPAAPTSDYVQSGGG